MKPENLWSQKSCLKLTDWQIASPNSSIHTWTQNCCRQMKNQRSKQACFLSSVCKKKSVVEKVKVNRVSENMWRSAYVAKKASLRKYVKWNITCKVEIPIDHHYIMKSFLISVKCLEASSINTSNDFKFDQLRKVYPTHTPQKYCINVLW